MYKPTDKNHKFGFCFIEDLIELYGEDYEQIEAKRKELYLLNKNDRNIFMILSNPVPIEMNQFNEWKIDLVNKGYDLKSDRIKPVMDFIEEYHLIV